MNNNEGNLKKLRGKDDRSIPTLFKIAMWPKLVSEDSHKVPLFCLVGSSPTIATWKTHSNFFIYKNWVLCSFNVFRKLSGHHLNGCRILFWYSNNLGSNPSDPTNYYVICKHNRIESKQHVKVVNYLMVQKLNIPTGV